MDARHLLHASPIIYESIFAPPLKVARRRYGEYRTGDEGVTVSERLRHGMRGV